MKRLIVSLATMLVAAYSAPTFAREIQHFLPGSVQSDEWEPRLLLREQLPSSGDRSRPVLYIHGASFPSALSIMFQIEGRSWADELNSAGFDVFGLDFAGYGGSERYAERPASSPLIAPPGRAGPAAMQIERAVNYILNLTAAKKVAIIAHSWGTIPAGQFAGMHPELLDKIVFFGPIAQRNGTPPSEDMPPFRLITPEWQHSRFSSEVPAGHQSVLVESAFGRWAEAYLASDPSSSERMPPSVKIPTGFGADLDEAWSGRLPYRPALVKAPVLIVRGEWDSITTDADAAWLTHAFTSSPHVEDVVIPRATHVMHLEKGRVALYAAVNAFLNGRDASQPARTDRRDPKM